MFLVGLATYIGLFDCWNSFCSSLGNFGWSFEIIPYLEISCGRDSFYNHWFGISPVLGVATAGVAILIQQLRNYV